MIHSTTLTPAQTAANNLVNRLNSALEDASNQIAKGIPARVATPNLPAEPAIAPADLEAALGVEFPHVSLILAAFNSTDPVKRAAALSAL